MTVVDYPPSLKRYALSVEVKLVELPNQFDEPEEPPPSTDDPGKMLGHFMGKLTRAPMVTGAFFPGQSAGFDFRKTASVTVSNFAALASIIECYDALTRKIEAEQP